jgi:3-dehydroquinate synthase class II
MTKVDILDKIITKALENGFDWDIDAEDWAEVSNLGKVVVLKALLDQDIYTILVFNREFAKALWGDDFSSQYDISEHKEDNRIVTNKIPLKNFEYHLRRLVIAEDRFKYLEENT